MYYSICMYYSIYNMSVIPDAKFLCRGYFCVGTYTHVDPKLVTFWHIADVLPTCCQHSQLSICVGARDNNDEGGVNSSFLSNDDEECQGPFDAAAMPSSQACIGSEKRMAGDGAIPKRKPPLFLSHWKLQGSHCQVIARMATTTAVSCLGIWWVTWCIRTGPRTSRGIAKIELMLNTESMTMSFVMRNQLSNERRIVLSVSWWMLWWWL